jgi:hypothetical protein
MVIVLIILIARHVERIVERVRRQPENKDRSQTEPASK